MGQKTVDNDNDCRYKLFFDSELHDFGAVVILRVTSTQMIWQSSNIFTAWSEITYEDNIVSTENLLLFLFSKILL